MTKVLHIINGLRDGGAENMLYKLLKFSNNGDINYEVISLLDSGTLGPEIERLGIKVIPLNINLWNLLKNILFLIKYSKKFDTVSTWLYVSDFIGLIIKIFNKRIKLVWNIRHSNINFADNSKLTWVLVHVNQMFNEIVDVITYNSNKSKIEHEKIGYSNKKSIIVSNGFDTEKFKFDKSIRDNIRKKLSISNQDFVIITVGRWNIQKDYETLIQTLNLLNKENINFKMIMVGKELDYNNQELTQKIYSAKLDKKVLLMGPRKNIPELLSAADLYLSTSIGESFSNSIGEAMAMELNILATDVGDTKLIVGDTGKIVPPKNEKKLCANIKKIIHENNYSRNILARKRIIEKYSINEVVNVYEKTYI